MQSSSSKRSARLLTLIVLLLCTMVGAVVFYLSTYRDVDVAHEVTILAKKLVTRGEMRYSLSTDKTSYTRGESVNVTYRVTNTTPSTQHFEFADSCEFQLLVKKPDGTEVYTNIGVCFFYNPGYDLASEESKTYTHVWQLDKTIEGGQYTLEGSLRGGPGEEFGSSVQTAEVTIEE